MNSKEEFTGMPDRNTVNKYGAKQRDCKRSENVDERLRAKQVGKEKNE